MGRCFSSTCLPQRHARRVSDSHPGLVALPGSGAVLETPVAASLVAASSLAGAPGGHVVERVGSGVTALFMKQAEGEVVASPYVNPRR